MNSKDRNGAPGRRPGADTKRANGKLSLSEQVARISNGSYNTTISDRAATSRGTDRFDPKENFSSFSGASRTGRAAENMNISQEGSADTGKIQVSRSNLHPVTNRTGDTGPGRRPPQRRKVTRKRLTAKVIVLRSLLVLVTVIAFTVIAAYTLAFTIAHGPSVSARNKLVLNAKQASATKWVPSLVLDGDTVSKILEDSRRESMVQIDISEYEKQNAAKDVQLPADDSTAEEEPDRWADSTDGIYFETVRGSTYKAYILWIKDPSSVYVATSSDNYANAKYGMTLFDCADRYQCLAAINGGEFLDSGGMGTGAKPMGVTYSRGSLVWEDGYTDRTFIGFDADNKMIVCEGMNRQRADELRIRDAVCFQNNNVLIDSSDGKVNVHYYDGDTGTAQRTAIGQCADGSVIFLVTDGRSTSSLGATKNDVIDMMVERGAVTAAMLDGGSSAMMYYRDYADKYGIDKSILDEYQKKGMVNKFKAFTEPRYIPTYFVVRGEGVADAG